MIYLFWIIALISSATPAGLYYDNLLRAQLIVLLLAVLPKLNGELLLASVMVIYMGVVSLFMASSPLQTNIELVIFFAWWVWLRMRPEIATNTLNPYTIHIGFYKGNKSSLKMNMSELLGLPVKSVCVIARDTALRLKDGTYNIVPAQSINSSGNYLVIDTGVVATDEYMNLMKGYQGVKSKDELLYSNCITTIRKLLGAIGYKYYPSGFFDNIPSMYLRKVLKYGRKED